MLIRIGAISVHQTAFTLAFIYGGCSAVWAALFSSLRGSAPGIRGKGSSGSRFRWRTSC